MKAIKRLIFVGILMFLVWNLPFFQKAVFPQKYWPRHAQALSESIEKLENRVKQQAEKIEEKKVELQEYKQRYSNNDDFVRKIKVKQDLIYILESIQRRTRVTLSSKKERLKQAEEML
ncbi:MAG: hypothetical protein GY853_00405 [PVC group bacterium]|nr:hypothetical protein [PVC group bacterium]